MEQRTIQLVTKKTVPEWWTRVQALVSGTHAWSSGRELNAQASVVVIPRGELLNIRKEELSQSKIFVVADDSWTAQNLKRTLALVRGALFLDAKAPPEEQARVLEVALARQAEREKHSQMMQMMRLQNRRIEELNSGLERSVEERTAGVVESRRASRENISRVREIIGFIKDMAGVLEISALLPLIRKQVKEYHRLESPLLFVPRGESFGDFYYLRGSQTIRTSKRAVWEATPRLRVNDPGDSRFLADALSRPFGKIIRFPLITGRHQKDARRAPLLLFEHNLAAQDLEPLVSSLSEKLQPVSWALDRLILEEELKGTSRDWEMTFDGLVEPIAILDPDGRVLRANAHWSKDFSGLMEREEPRLRVGTETYVVEKYPIRMSPEEQPLSWVVYLRNETRSQKLKSQVVQVEKMSAIGQLAGHIAHELNNPLTGIRSLTQVLLTEVPAQDQVHKDLDEVERASARCQGIINNLLDFSKGALEHKVQVMDLNEITKRTLPFLKSATGKFRSDIQLSEDELPVKVEPHLMQQVIFNLVNNACQAMSAVSGRGSEIAVHTRRSAHWAVLEIKDTGPGIEASLRERIFEPFFTTKGEGEGTGLGLSLSRDFVRQFGGDLELESEVGHGSTFRVRLPLDVT